jgi:TP901 family phage tail tape measure protein
LITPEVIRIATSVGSASVEITATTQRARQAVQDLVKQSRTLLGTLTGVTVGATVKLKGPTRAEVNAALSGIRAEKIVSIKIDSADAVTRITQIRTLLTSLGATVSGLFNVNTAGFGAILSGGTSMITRFQAVVAELRRVLTEIRNTRPPTGPPAGAGGSAGAGANLNPYAAQLRALQGDLKNGVLSTVQFETATRALKVQIEAEITSLRSLGVMTEAQQRKYDSLRATAGSAAQAIGRIGGGGGGASSGIEQLGRELAIAQSRFDRGDVSLRTYLRDLERIRAAGVALGAGLQAGSAEARKLEIVLGGANNAFRNINSSSIVKLRTDLALARAEFERASVAAGGFSDKRAAIQSYTASITALEQRIEALGRRSSLSSKQVRELAEVTRQLAAQRAALDGIASPLGISGSILNALRSLPQFAAAAGGSLGAAAAQATVLGGTLTELLGISGLAVAGLVALAAAVAGVAVALTASIKTAADFEQSLADINALTQPTAEQFEQIQQAAFDIGKPLGVGARDAASAILELNRAGLSAADVIGGGLKGALELAGAAGVTAAEGSKIAVAAMTAFEQPAANLPRIADVYANFANKTFLGASNLQDALASVGPVAKQAGLNFEEFAGYMATLAQGGFKRMTDAGTSLKTMLLSLMAPADTAQNALNRLGYKTYDSQGKFKGLSVILSELGDKLKYLTEEDRNRYLKEIFGTDAIRAGTILLSKGNAVIDENIKAMGLQGEAARVASERLNSYRGASKQLAASFEQLKIQIGTPFLKGLADVAKGLTDIVDAATKLGQSADTLRGYLIPLGVVLAAFRGQIILTATTAAWGTLTGILVALPGLITAVGAALTAFVASNPIGLIATVAAGVTLWANSIINDTQRIYDAMDAANNKSSEVISNKVAALRALGTDIATAQAEHLRALEALSQAQTGRISGTNFFTGERRYVVDPAEVKAAQIRLDAAKAELEAAKERNRIINPNTLTGAGPLQPGQVRAGVTVDPVKVPQKFTTEFLTSLLNSPSIRGDKSIDAWCADVASKIQAALGNDLKYSNGAGKLRENAVNAGYTRIVDPKDARPGDMVFYKGEGYGARKSGNHVESVLSNNNGQVQLIGANNSAQPTIKDFYDPAHATIYRAPTSPYAGKVTKTVADQAAVANAKIAKLTEDAQHLYNQQQLAIKSGNQVWLAKINADITVFKKAHAEVWKSIADTNKDGADKTVQVTDAQYAKFQKRAKELAALEARTRGKGAVEATADLEISKFTKNPVAAKVLQYERDALKERTSNAKEAKDLAKKSADEQAAVAREAAQGQVAAAQSALERLKTIQTRALVNAGDDVTARAKIARDGANAIAGAEKKIADAQLKLDQDAAQALAPANRQAALDQAQADYTNRLSEIETDRLRTIKESGKTIQEEQTKLDQQLREGRIADARLTLDRITGINERELIRFKGTAAERLKIVTRQAGVESAAKLKVAEAQKKLDDAAANALPVGQQAAALARSKTTFENAQRDIENARLRVVRESNEALKAEQQQFDAQVREGQVEQARLTLERIQQLNEQELQRFAGTAAQREVIIRRQADAELAAKEQLAVAQKKIDDAAALALAPGLQAGALSRAKTTSDNAVRAAQIERDRIVQEAKAATKEEVDQAAARQKAAQALERDLRQLNERFAQQVKAGNVTADSVLRYKQSLEDLRAKASELPAALQANIKGLLTQGATLGTQGQGIANYRTEIDKLKDAVDGWAYAELEAARARVIANGGDPKKLAILDAEIAKRKTLTGVQLQQLQAENQVAGARTGTSTLEGQLANAQAQAKGNLATLYSLELEYGGKIQAARDAQARTEADDEIRQVNEKYKKLGELEGLSRKDRLELAAAQGKALADIETRYGIAVAKNASDRSAAELNAKTALDAALVSTDRATRDTIRKNALDLLARQTADLEAAQAQELSAEGLTQAQILDIRKRYQPLLVEQKKKEVAASREIETQAENDRYADAVDAARQNGTLQTVAAKLLEEHTSNLGAIERRGTDAVRDYELSTKRDVGQAILAADKATSEELVKTGQERIDRELEGLADMTEAQRQLAVQTLEFWREVYTAQGAVGKAALADVDAAIAKIGAAGRTARRQATDLGVVDAALPDKFTRDLNAIGKDEDAEDARATAEAKYNGLLETYQGFLKKTEDAARQFEGLSDEQLTPDERVTRDGLLANITLYDDFIAQITGKAKEAGEKASAAFTQAQADKTAEAALSLAEAEYARAQQGGTDGSPAYRAGLQASLDYWKARLVGLKTGSPEYLAALQKITELEGKLVAVSPEKIKDQEQAASLALLEARHALAEAEGRDDSPAYLAGLNASLAYWRARLLGLKEGTPDYLAALQQIADLEGKITSAQGNTPLVNRLKNLSGIIGKNGSFQKTVTAGLDGLAAYFSAGGSKGGRKAILAGAEALVGGLGEVFKTGNEETDQVISTFVSGVQGTLSALAKGDWIGAIIAGVATVVGTILDIFQGGKKSMQKAKAEIEEATKGIKFFDVSKYAKVEARDGFWGWLGFKKSTIDQESLDIARSLGDALYEAISGGMLDGIKAGKTSFASLNLDLKKSLAQSILQGLIDGFLQGEIMKKLIQPFLDQYIAAQNTADPTDDVKAASDLQAAIITGNNRLAQFYEGVLVPTATQLGVFGTDGQSSSPLGGNAVSDLGLVSAPAVVSAAPAWAMEFTGASIGLTKAFNEVIPVLNRIATDGFSVDAQAQVILQNAPSDLRAYATR